MDSIHETCWVTLTVSLKKIILFITDEKRRYQQVTVAKQKFVKPEFDNNLYYGNGIYRTPTMLDCLSRNHLKMTDKGLHIIEKKEISRRKSLRVVPEGAQSNPFYHF